MQAYRGKAHCTPMQKPRVRARAAQWLLLLLLPSTLLHLQSALLAHGILVEAARASARPVTGRCSVSAPG